MQQAYAEAGETRLTPGAGRMLVGLIAALWLLVPLLDSRSSSEAALRLLQDARAALGAGAPLAANRWLRAALESFEDQLESGSILRRELLPRAQWLMTALLGAGNEEAIVARDGWLYYAPDLSYVTGPSFLEPRPARPGAREEREADPLPAILAFGADLEARGIQLVLLPTPSKVMLHPEGLGAPAGARLHNPAFPRFAARLEAAGVAVLDPLPALREVAGRHGQAFLRTDTHWTPQAVSAVARDLARFLRARLRLEPLARYQAGRQLVSTHGDIVRMLRLPPQQGLFPPESAVIEPVAPALQDARRVDPAAQVLLLGDSYTNIYSIENDIHWGRSAGLAEQLSRWLEAPVDRIALDAGGAHSSRQALAAELARGRDRLDGKRAVVWQLALRDLSSGDWPIIPLPRAAPARRESGARELGVTARVASLTRVPEPGETPYPDFLIALHLQDVVGLEPAGRAPGELLAYAWGLRDGRRMPAAELGPGRRIHARLVAWEEVEARYGSLQRRDPDDLRLLRLPAYWLEEQRPAE